MSLIQLMTVDGNKAIIFDLLMCSDLITVLKGILESEDIIKIVYDSKNIAINLYNQFNINLKCVFDLQVAHSVFCHEKEESRPFKKVIRFL